MTDRTDPQTLAMERIASAVERIASAVERIASADSADPEPASPAPASQPAAHSASPEPAAPEPAAPEPAAEETYTRDDLIRLVKRGARADRQLTVDTLGAFGAQRASEIADADVSSVCRALVDALGEE